MAERRAKNLTYLRASNQGSIIQTLLTTGAASRQFLAGSLNLTKMSISYIVGELMEKGVVAETEADSESQPQQPGRKPVMLTLCPDSILAVGVYVSRSQITSSLCNIAGVAKRSITRPVPAKTTKQSLTDIILADIGTLLEDCENRQAVCGIGLTSIGLIDSGSGSVVSTTSFHNIADWPVKQILEEAFSLPVQVANDMKGACLAELYYGRGKPYSDFVYLGVSNGLAAGVVINGKLFEGSRGFSSEIGHTTIHSGGKRCTCGSTGCAELYLSVPVVVKKSGFASWQEFISFSESEETNPTLERFIIDMGILLTNTINSFDPEAIVIGHEGAYLGSYCFEKLQVYVNQHAMTRRVKKVEIIPSALLENTVHLSPISAVFSQLFRGAISL